MGFYYPTLASIAHHESEVCIWCELSVSQRAYAKHGTQRPWFYIHILRMWS